MSTYGNKQTLKALIKAIHSGNEMQVRGALLQHTNVTECDSDGNSPLHHAALDGSLAIVALLLQQGASPLLVNVDNFTPLHTAIYYAHRKPSNDADEQPKRKNKRTTPEYQAVALRLIERIQVSAADNLTISLMHWAAAYGDEEILNALERQGFNYLANSQGVTPLVSAVQSGNTRTIPYLLLRSELSTSDYLPALRLAITLIFGHIPQDIVPQIINVPDSEGRTLLHHAAVNPSLSLVELLISSGGNHNARDLAGNNPLMHSIIHRGTFAIIALLASQTDAATVNNNECNALLLAIHHNRNDLFNLPIMRTLMGGQNNPSPDSEDEEHSTDDIFPLIWELEVPHALERWINATTNDFGGPVTVTQRSPARSPFSRIRRRAGYSPYSKQKSFPFDFKRFE